MDLARVMRVVFDRQRHRGGQPDPRVVTAAAVPRRDPGVQGAHVAVVGQGLVAGGGVRGVALDRDVGVLGHVERGKAVLVGELGGRRRGDAAITGEKHKPVVHAQN